MEYFHIVKDSDFSETSSLDHDEYSLRPTANGFVIDNNRKIALLSLKDKNHYGLPGGGVEEGETPEEAFIRECQEEIGCTIYIDSFLGCATQYRAQTARQYEIYYFIAHVVGEKGTPTTVQDDEQDNDILWCSKGETQFNLVGQIKTIENGDYSMQFNRRSHLAAFEKFTNEVN